MPVGGGVFFCGMQQYGASLRRARDGLWLLGQFAEVKSEADQLPFGLNFF
jgi:hypothetical protein